MSRTVLLLFLIGGCAGEPYPQPPLPALDHPDPRAIRVDFASRLAPRFVTDDNVTLSAPFHDQFAVLGSLRIDRPAGTFQLVGLNPLGVQLFELSGDRKATTIHFAIPPLMEQQWILKSIGDDIRRIDFDVIPPADATVDIATKSIRYRRRTQKGTLVYTFGGNPAVLLEKRLDLWFGSAWRIRYGDYAGAAGLLYPRWIVMDNDRGHYRLILKNLTWQKQ